MSFFPLSSKQMILFYFHLSSVKWPFQMWKRRLELNQSLKENKYSIELFLLLIRNLIWSFPRLHLNIWIKQILRMKGGKKEKHEVIIDAILYSYIHLLVIFKWSEAGVGCLSLSLLPLLTHRHLFCFIWLSNQKKNENTRAKRNVRQDEDAAIQTHIYTKCKKESKWLLSLKKKTEKKKKKETCSLFSPLVFCESLRVMIKVFFFFFYFCISTILFFLT